VWRPWSKQINLFSITKFILSYDFIIIIPCDLHSMFEEEWQTTITTKRTRMTAAQQYCCYFMLIEVSAASVCTSCDALSTHDLWWLKIYCYYCLLHHYHNMSPMTYYKQLPILQHKYNRRLLSTLWSLLLAIESQSSVPDYYIESHTTPTVSDSSVSLYLSTTRLLSLSLNHTRLQPLQNTIVILYRVTMKYTYFIRLYSIIESL